MSSGETAWPDLSVDTDLTLVKLAPDGRETARYVGTVIDAGVPRPWVAVIATWTHRAYDLDGLLLLPGDTMHEFFSPVDWFNAFSVFSPEGMLRGWYANVAYPARLDRTTEPFTLTWHDLYVDLVALPDGTVVVRDEDELAEAGIAVSDPPLHERIKTTCNDLVRLATARACPFHEGHWPVR
ncbi:MAG: DUF402 domain-containing protein [Thermomicrobiales bacterium]